MYSPIYVEVGQVVALSFSFYHDQKILRFANNNTFPTMITSFYDKLLLYVYRQFIQ